ncbi:bactofilin family protein [Mucilaginibacter gotjawali]|uniref:Cytoskeletal protein CcmA (Bactofilin family) n=2 Tax=Mucilaginibacter gotjawali TaxID=1550579 RepID=A0A839SN45_9SPHI|nr:polymer-forming cytoskeletal protein [Mucilaginibacter gotjawali]MBB3057909.1 cytoskeletal protein CcmA (bactofilin family) [Mucilaginibacter gotjawali]BAU52319.1 Polymer-forming cytoskeletal [Mucilaginibacter gotjawali]
MSIFSKKDKVTLDLQSISTLISEGSILDGNLKAPAFARIDGQVTGDVMVDEGLILGEKGSILGNIITKEMVVYGTITGNIQTNSLEIKASGKISGEIRTQTLVVENGAVYNGSLSMTQNHKLAQSQNHKLSQPKPKMIEVG